MKKHFITFMLSAFSVAAFGQVGIGTTTPDKNAMLDVVSTNKGILAPRLNLTSSTLDLNGDGDNSVANQPQGLLIYNTGTTFTKGYYFWNGSEWRNINNATTETPTISNLNCFNASLIPSSYTSGTPYTGVLKVPYNGGNGGFYTGGTFVTVNGLKFTLQGGELAEGSGDLIFNVTGTPTATSPTTTSLTVNNSLVPFYTGSCSVTVGGTSSAEVRTFAVIDHFRSTSDQGRAGYSVVITTPDGKFSVRAFIVSGNNFSTANLQLRNNSSSTVSISSNAAWLWGGSGGNEVRSCDYPANVWAGYAGNSGALNGVDAVVQASNNNPSWGNAAVMQSNRPEQRLYMWSTTDATKTTYILRFMASSQFDNTADSGSCPNGVCTSSKGTFYIEQVTGL